MAQTWQIGAGEAGRFYSDLFLAYDVMFLGPGRFGPYDHKTYRNSGWPKRAGLEAARLLREDVCPGDRIVVRHGLRVVALGIVDEEGYVWQEAFDDVHGWDLQHTQRVVWQPQLSAELAALQKERPLFSHMKQIKTFTRLNPGTTLAVLEPLFERAERRDLRNLPADLPAPLSLEELGEALFSRGLSNDAVEKAIDCIRRQRRLLTWYERHGGASDRPTEHEIVAHIVLPLLLALGWSEQLLGIEWHRIDLAAFWATPTTAEHCVLICEAKAAGHGLQNVLDQGRRYARDLKLDRCEKIVLTDGGRLYLHEREASGEFGSTATGYINFRSLRTGHLVPADTSAVDTLIALTPAGASRPLAKRASNGVSPVLGNH